MSSNDVRDILDVKASEPRPAKKQKVVARRPDNISKEVFGLLGERAPPVMLQDEKYQKRLKVSRKVQHWEQQAFTNPSRADGLVLKHWRKKRDQQPSTLNGPATPGDRNDDAKAVNSEDPPYHWSKYDIQVNVPSYTDAEYDSKLRSSQWSKGETDYLMSLARDFDLRWVVIWDRYDYHPEEEQGNGQTMAVIPIPAIRTMEDMKARYYEVAAKMMAVRQPLASMSSEEFNVHEVMLKFDPTREANRKRLAEALLARTPDEVREEELLLSELKRIVINEDKFLQERQELYDRLDHPVAQGSISMYESSAGLIQLTQTLLSADKSRKKKLTSGSTDNVSSPVPPNTAQTMPGSSRDARNQASTSHPKKGPQSAGLTPRQLNPRDEAKYGISHHERLNGGVSVRQARIEKLVLAKSAAQAQKLQDALGELGIPIRAVMPTNKVCTEYEHLVAALHNLLDLRKLNEKMNNEIRILTVQKEARERKERGEVETPVTGEKPVEKGLETPTSAKAEADTSGIGHEDNDVSMQDSSFMGGAGSVAHERADVEDESDDADGEADKDVAESEDEEHEEKQGADPEQNDENEDEDEESNEEEDEDGNEAEEIEEEQEEAEDDSGNLATSPAEDEAGAADAEGDEDEEDEVEEEDEDSGEEQEEDDEEQEGDEDDEAEAEVEEGTKAGSRGSTGRNSKHGSVHKRSASVMSTASQKSAKKQRK